MILFAMMSAWAMNAQRGKNVVAQQRVMLPWERMMQEKWSFGENVAWAAYQVTGYDLNYNDGVRAGAWGLTKVMAQYYGLRVDRTTDERFDLGRATEAFCKYMKDLIRVKNDTVKAIETFVNTALVSEDDLIYVRYDDEHGKVDMAALDSAFAVTDEQRAEAIARAEAEEAERVRLEQERLKAEAEERARAEAEANRMRWHVVKSGDTLSGLARKYHCRVSDLQKWNKLRGDMIRIGQKLRVH